MEMKNNRWMHVVLCCLFCLWLAVPAMAADGLFSTVTDDGVTLKMLRYRPAPDANFRVGGQPVLLFPGIVCNMNAFLSFTPEERTKDYAGMTLPVPIADWAKDDPYIQADPMRYYSLAHYLWLKGYDVWLANYRGTGRGEFVSDKGNLLTNNDVWGILDAVACVNKVVEVTGQAPFIGGHSTGGFTCYAYLQGATFDLDELKEGAANGYTPHVKANPLLAAARNAMIKGYIALDPGLTPNVPQSIDVPLMWEIFGQAGYLDLDTLMENVVNPLITDSDIMITAIDTVMDLITEVNSEYGEYLDIIPCLDFWYMANMHPFVNDFFARYACSSVYIRGLGQWGDIGLHRSIREFWRNGAENKDVVQAPEPDPGRDGYYYYDRNMHLLTIPTIAILSYSDALVRADDVITYLMEAKTYNAGDEYHLIPNSAHLDVICGLNAPYITFPLIGVWLDKECAKQAAQAGTGSASAEDAKAANTATSGSSDGSSKGMCFIETVLGA